MTLRLGTGIGRVCALPVAVRPPSAPRLAKSAPGLDPQSHCIWQNLHWDPQCQCESTSLWIDQNSSRTGVNGFSHAFASSIDASLSAASRSSGSRITSTRLTEPLDTYRTTYRSIGNAQRTQQATGNIMHAIQHHGRSRDAAPTRQARDKHAAGTLTTARRGRSLDSTPNHVSEAWSSITSAWKYMPSPLAARSKTHLCAACLPSVLHRLRCTMALGRNLSPMAGGG